MSLRRIPPVHSPIRLVGLLRGAAEALGWETGATAEVSAWLRERFESRGAVLTDGGTSALSLALRLASRGRPVALPAYACYDLATAADGADLPVLLYDVDPASLQPDWDSVAAALEQGAGALVVVHLYGVPVDLDRAGELAASAGAWLIEDAAQGAGGRWKGRPLGSSGDFAVLSFGRGKGVTGGAGGALLAHSPRAIDALTSLSPVSSGGSGLGALLRAAAQWLLGRPALYWIPSALPFLRLGETVYHPVHPPSAMPRGAVGLLANALGLTDREAEVRRGNARRLAGGLTSRAGLGVVSQLTGGVPGYLRYPLVPEAEVRSRLSGSVAAARGVTPGYPLSLADLPGFEHRVTNRAAPFPGARALAARLVTCATHSLQNRVDLEQTIEAISLAASHHTRI